MDNETTKRLGYTGKEKKACVVLNHGRFRRTLLLKCLDMCSNALGAPLVFPQVLMRLRGAVFEVLAELLNRLQQHRNRMCGLNVFCVFSLCL